MKILTQKNTVEKNQATVSIEKNIRTGIDIGDDLGVVVALAKILTEKKTVEKNQVMISIENHTLTRIDKGDDLEVVVMKNIVKIEDDFIFGCLF